MLYPNGQRVLAASPRAVSGALAQSGALGYGGIRGARFNRTAVFAKTASVPEGYAPFGAPILPVKAGGMVGVGRITTSSSGNMLNAVTMTGTADILTLASSGDMGLVVSMSASTAILTWTTSPGEIKLTLGMDGSGSFGITGAGNLSLIVPFEGTGTVASITGAGDMRGILSMSGAWTPFSELSPEGLAAAVWGAVAASNNDAGTMGSKLNTASSGGVDYPSLAGAVRTELQAELLRIVELAKIHGLVIGADLVVTPTSRAAGDIAQTIAAADSTVTVSRT